MRILFLIVAAGLSAMSFCNADELELQDTLILKTGSQLTGKILDRQTENNREYIIFRTTSGGVLKLDIKRLVKRVHAVDSEYKDRLAQMDETSADAHRAMYEWCKEKDKSAFKREMEFHLRRIIELDRNDTTAMKLLGFDRFDGKLLHEDHKLSGHGYVRMTGGWVPEQFLDVHNYEQHRESLMNEKKTAFTKWTRKIGKIDNRSLAAELKADDIVNQYTVGLVYQKALKEDRDDIRWIYVNAIGEVDSMVAQNALVHFSIRDKNNRIREQAASLLQQPHFDLSSAALKAGEFLRDKDRTYLLRAANLINELNQLSPFNELVDALQTTHVIAPGDDPRRTTSTFGNSATGAPTHSFGSKKPIKQNFDNQEVLAALQRITGQRIGYDRDAWKAWYVSEHTIDRYDLRGDQ